MIERKKVCKQELLELFGLSHDHLDRPLIGIVSRFADQKGFDLIAEKSARTNARDLVLVVLERASASMKIFQGAGGGIPGPRGREDRL